MASSSVRSPSTSSQPSSVRLAARSGERTSTTTSSPRSRRIAATRPPMKPVAPVTNARIPLPQLLDDGVRDLRGPHGGGVVAGRLHVVGHAPPLLDDGGGGCL